MIDLLKDCFMFQDCVVMVFANKQDLDNAASVVQLREKLELHKIKQTCGKDHNHSLTIIKKYVLMDDLNK
jgi:signal recognition particle receptor subunit beta